MPIPGVGLLVRGIVGYGAVTIAKKSRSGFAPDPTYKSSATAQGVRGMIALRKRHPNLMRRRFLNGKVDKNTGHLDIQWHGRKLAEPCWDDKHSSLLAFTLGANAKDPVPLHVLMNMSDKRRHFDLPFLEGYEWYCAVDTGKLPPDDISAPDEQQQVRHARYLTNSRSLVVLEARKTGEE